jgi:hypothetical protein
MVQPVYFLVHSGAADEGESRAPPITRVDTLRKPLDQAA